MTINFLRPVMEGLSIDSLFFKVYSSMQIEQNKRSKEQHERNKFNQR